MFSARVLLVGCFLIASVAAHGSASIGGNDIQVLRIVRSYANGVFLHCPLTSHQAQDLAGVYQLKWINEKDDFNKPDEQVQVTDFNLMLVADANLQISQALTYVSCGFISNYRYVRIKMWQLVFIDNPSVDISITSNPSLIEYKPINSTFSSICPVENVNPLTWNKPCDLLRIKCKNNFDHPINTRYVWMYIYNPLTYAYEIWHKYDVENEHEDNLYQLFYNPTTNKKMYLYEFIQLLYSRENYQVTFQCGSYYEESYSKEKICLIANSLNITIIIGEHHHKPSYSHHHNSVNTGLLIGVIIASILAFLFLLALLGFLIWCCCCRKRNTSSRSNTKHTASSSIIFPAVNTSSCSTTTTCHNAELLTTTSYNNMLNANGLHHQSNCNLNALAGTGCASSSGANYLCSPSSSHIMTDKCAQFSNQMDCGGGMGASSTSMVGGGGGVCSKPTDVYLSMLTIHKDACDDDEINTAHMQQQCQEEFISAYHHQNGSTMGGVGGSAVNYGGHHHYQDDALCHQHSGNNYLQNCRPQQQTEYNFHYV